ncbi:type II secretion system protein GspL [Rheinheimera sp. D18]|uniref:type II secretion system protein GspL n=1 Tax=Rheinheimera sp. D18 TaxID=2545632 RepID=UPI0010488F36|nr:type II secretion system protein GspL [Rheinheimera sp. D18]QBL10628.1 type II secretion system protein GspL [Rheinheimera sp. D18]
MSEQLVIRLGSRAEHNISWLVWAGQNQDVIASGEVAGVAQLTELCTRLGNRPVIALVPASDVVLKQVNLPSKPNRQLLQALPYMLEEEQAEDIEKLFLALGSVQHHDGQYSQQVAVCQHERMQQWLDWLQSAGFSVSRILPDALLLPEQQLPACIQLQNQWLLKQSSWQVSAIDVSWWGDYLQLAGLPMLTSYSPWPDELAQSHQLAEPELPLALLASQLQHNDFNLLQGEYKPKRQVNRQLQLWRSSAILFGACLSIYLLQLGISNWQLSRQSAALQQQSQTLYLQAFPQERIVNLNLQLKQKLAAVGGNSEQNFLVLLDSLQQQIAKVPDISLENLRYDGKRAELRFEAKGDSFQSFEKLKSALEQVGFSVEQGALSNDGGKVQGSVAMRGKV